MESDHWDMAAVGRWTTWAMGNSGGGGGSTCGGGTQHRRQRRKKGYVQSFRKWADGYPVSLAHRPDISLSNRPVGGLSLARDPFGPTRLIVEPNVWPEPGPTNTISGSGPGPGLSRILDTRRWPGPSPRPNLNGDYICRVGICNLLSIQTAMEKASVSYLQDTLV